jgi:choline kinase
MGNPSPALVVLAAGLGSRYGGAKQLEAVGPGGATLMDYAVFDAVRAGIARVVFVIREQLDPLIEPLLVRWTPHIEVRAAYQDRPVKRAKPWGTAHAVLAAEAMIEGPFLVVNADDFYGAAAYEAAADHLRTSNEWAVVGYPIAQTLSEHGGVNRAVLRRDDEYLREVAEVRDIRASDVRYRDELVSMNLWAFTGTVFPALHEAFERFAATAGPADELLLPDVVGALIAAGKTRVRVLQPGAEWFGMTHRDDRDRVRDRLASLVSAGTYPERLA